MPKVNKINAFEVYGSQANWRPMINEETFAEMMEEVSKNLTTEQMQDMPWDHIDLTTIEFMHWVAGRKTAGKTIDAESCEINVWRCNWHDVYGLLYRLGLLPEEIQDCFGKEVFVRSPDSNGWVCRDDLPSATVKKLNARMDRERKAYLKANPPPKPDPRVAAETLRILEEGRTAKTKAN